MFTPYERRQLRLIEEWFEKDDPQLARTLRSGSARKPFDASYMIAICVTVALAVLGLVTGAFMLIFGAMISGVVTGCMVTNRRRKHP